MALIARATAAQIMRPQLVGIPPVADSGLMAPALFVELSLEARRQTRCLVLFGRIAPWAGLAAAAAGTGALAFPRPVRMVLAHPAAVLAKQALHQAVSRCA